MTKNVEQIIKTESLDEANQLLASGWVLLEHNSVVVDGSAKYFILLGKKAKTPLERLVDELDSEHKE